MDVSIINNKGENTVVNELKKSIRSGSKVAVASAYFSLYAFDALQKELDKAEDFKFLYTKPTFYKKENEIKRQYKIEARTSDYPKFQGNEFEIRLRNQMTGSSIAQKAQRWIKEKAQFKTLISEETFPKEILVENDDEKLNVHMQSEVDFTADGLGITESNRIAGIPVIKGNRDFVQSSMKEFDRIWSDNTKTKDVTREVLNQIDLIYKENSPEWIYFVTLYNVFSDELEGISEENIIKEGTNFKDTTIWNKLYPFQKDGVVGIIDKIEKYNGCILADSVGLGKTFSALAVIKYYELRNDRVLVLAPKKLRDNWTVYTQNDKRNILNTDRFNYDVLNHTDLSRENGQSGEINLSTINWSNYDLVVIDESHNFRNNTARNDRLTRYQKLMQDIIQKGVKTKVLMLSATPVNNKMNDIKNQIAFITENEDSALDFEGIDSIERTLTKAQTAFNRWTELPVIERTTASFLEMVDADYFQLLDLISIARSRKHIEKYYTIQDIGEFPERLKPVSIKSSIDTSNELLTIKEMNALIESLVFSIYQPMKYVLPSKRRKYEEMYDTSVKGGKTVFKQSDREFAVAALMKVNMFKRLESSVHSFRLTLERLRDRLETTLDLMNIEQLSSNTWEETEDFNDDELEDITVGSKKVQIKLRDIDRIRWSQDLKYDLEQINKIISQVNQISTERDAKLRDLTNLMKSKIENPINPGNKKIIIFSAFADTVNYLYKELSPQLEKIGLHSAIVTGSGNNQTTLKHIRKTDLNDILINFSPLSKERHKVTTQVNDEIDILFATDCISEGQNLQDCDYLINYDIHWNPVRVIQRFGRIDRIGSRNKKIQLVNFWPNMDLDEYINLETRVKGRMKILSASATGEEDVFDTSGKEMNDIAYRRNQLKTLQEDVVNLEDISGAISITDLTYTDFKSDLSTALKKYKEELEKAPKGMYAVASNEELKEADSGVIFCLKEVTGSETSKNNLAPYILLYLKDNGEAKYHYTQSKKILDVFRKVSLGQDQPLSELVSVFNQETENGEDMSRYTGLLKSSIDIVKDKQEDNVFESFFSIGGTDIQSSLDLDFNDIELISFLVIKGA